MATIEEKIGKKPSVHISNDDGENAEEVGYNMKSPSTALTLSLEDSVQLKRIKDHRKEILKRKIDEIKKTCEIYGIDFSEIR